MRTDDQGAVPIKALMELPGVDWKAVDDVYGCANFGPARNNRNVARSVAYCCGAAHRRAGATINRLCGSGLDAVGTTARAIKAGEARAC